MNNVVPLHPPAQPSPMVATFNADQLVSKLLQLRAKIAEIKKGHKEELEKFNQAEEYLEGRLMTLLNENNVRSMATTSGTFYTSKDVSARVDQWSKTLDFIRDNEMWELLEARVSKVAAQAVIEELNAKAEAGAEPATIPGVTVTTGYRLNVRKA